MNLTIIDFTPLVYKILHRCSKDEQRKEDFSFYRESLVTELNLILEVTKADYYYCFTEGNTSFRKQLFSHFKADRNHSWVLFKTDLVKWAKDNLGLIYDDYLESDDYCAFYSNLNYAMNDTDLIPFYKPVNGAKPTNITVCTIDGDFKQIPGNHYNYNTKEFFTVTKEEAEFNLWQQVLIKGHNNKLDYLEKCGDDTAIKYLNKWKKNLRLGVIKSFMDGIDKKDYSDIRSSINGYGIPEGTAKFSRAYIQAYLLKNIDEILKINPEFELKLPVKRVIIEEQELTF
jgi:hypothetical protein